MRTGAAGKRWKDTGLEVDSYLIVTDGLEVLRRTSIRFPTSVFKLGIKALYLSS